MADEAVAPGGDLQAAAERGPIMLWESRAERRATWFNRRWLEFRGRSLAEELDLGWAEGVHPDDLGRLLDAFRDGYDCQAPFSVEYRLLTADGTFRWVLDHGVPRVSRTGDVLSYIGVCIDVHDTRAVLEASRTRERQQAMVADLGRFALEVEDQQELLDIAVKLVAEGLGVPLSAVLRLTEEGDELEIEASIGWDETRLPTNRVGADPSTMAGYVLLTDGTVVCDDLPDETRFVGGPGLRSHDVVSAISTVVRMPGGPYGVVGAYTPRSRAFGDDDLHFLRSVANLLGAWMAHRGVEGELRAREVEARLAFSTGSMGSWTWDPARNTVAWSREMEEVYGLEPGTFAGTFDAFMECVHPDDRAATAEIVGTATSMEEPFSLEHRAIRPDGSVIWLDGRGGPVRAADGTVTGWIGVGIDITDRKRVENELRSRELEMRLALAAGHMGFWRWNAATERGVWSPELEDLVGIERGSYDGTWESFIAPIYSSDGPLLRDVITTSAITGEEFAVGYRIKRADGVTRWIETRGRPLPEGREWIGVSIDVTDRREAEEALREANVQLEETVARLDTLLATAPLGFAFLDPEYRFVRVNEPMAATNGLPIDEHLGRRISEVLPGVGAEVEAVLQQVAETGAPVSDVEVSGQTPARPGVERHWLASYYPVISADGTLLGFGAMVVDITGRKRQERAASLTAGVSELLAANPQIDSVLEHTAALLVPDLADSCAVYLLPRTDVARRFQIAHVRPEMTQKLVAADERWPLNITSMLASSAELRAGKPILVPEVTDAMRAAFAHNDEQLALAEELGVVSSITAPLHVGDDVIGLLFLDYTKDSGRVHRPEDVALVEALADRIVLVLERAYLTTEAQRATARLDLLAEMGELLTIGLDTQARLETVTQVVVPTFADTCVAYVAQPDGLHVVARASAWGDAFDNLLDADVPVMPIDASDPVADAFRTSEPVIVEDVPRDLAAALNPVGPSAPTAPGSEVSSALVVPMLADGEPLGVLVFGYTESSRLYGAEDVGLAREIARRVAPAVDDAMRFERELATASALQMSLLPDRLPALQDAELAARYVPGGVGLKVGGDWYDAVPLRDGRVMLVIGDVVGHGVRAAASMGKLRNVLQYGALDGLAPAALLQRLNGYFCALSDADMATLFVAEYDPVGQTIRYSSAGHPPAVLRMPDGSVEMLDEGRGMPLCASEQAHYHEAERPLPAGSLLVLYTDGLIERRGESLDVGFERLADVVREAPDRAEKVADALLRILLGEGEPADDVALLCVGTAERGSRFSVELPAAPRQLAGMRRALGEWLERVGAQPVEVREITVAVNEIAANAIEHAYGLTDSQFVIDARVADDGIGPFVELEVRDFGRWRARRTRADRGRGLDLARALMDRVDVDSGDGGTVVRLQRLIGRAEERQ